jgi:hypothetical protein
MAGGGHSDGRVLPAEHQRPSAPIRRRTPAERSSRSGYPNGTRRRFPRPPPRPPKPRPPVGWEARWSNPRARWYFWCPLTGACSGSLDGCERHDIASAGAITEAAGGIPRGSPWRALVAGTGPRPASARSRGAAAAGTTATTHKRRPQSARGRLVASAPTLAQLRSQLSEQLTRRFEVRRQSPLPHRPTCLIPHPRHRVAAGWHAGQQAARGSASAPGEAALRGCADGPGQRARRRATAAPGPGPGPGGPPQRAGVQRPAPRPARAHRGRGLQARRAGAFPPLPLPRARHRCTAPAKCPSWAYGSHGRYPIIPGCRDPPACVRARGRGAV